MPPVTKKPSIKKESEMTSSATTTAYTASAFTDKGPAKEDQKPLERKRTTTTTTVVTKQEITMEEIAQIKAGSFEELRTEDKEGAKTITRVLTKSSKNFKQNPAKFKIGSSEESKQGSKEDVCTEEELKSIPEVD